MEPTNEKKQNIFRKLLSLPLLAKVLIINVFVLILLVIFFFMAGVYMYSPAKSARVYLEATYAEEWNTVYDTCIFPDKTFLTRKNFVNAKSYQTEQGENGKAEITTFSLRKKGSLGDDELYTVSYSLKGDETAYDPTLQIRKKGDTIFGLFHNWYVIPEELYATGVKFSVPKDAIFILDGMEIGEEYQVTSTDKAIAVYKIPYIFLGGHTLELQETGKEAYREVIEVNDGSDLQFIPELKLNDNSGREICNRAEKAIAAVYEAAAENKDFKTVSEYFSKDAVKAAETAFEELQSKFSTKKKKGIATVSITQISSAVTNKDEIMTADIKISYSTEEVYKKFFFFYRTRTKTDSVELSTTAVREDGVWVFDENIIAF